MQSMNPSRQSRDPVAVVDPTRIPTDSATCVLVAEDDSDVRQFYAHVLMRSGGYQVDAAEDGAAAWQALQARQYHLLITDHEMPNVTGVELVHKVRSARMALPVILATGSLPKEELERHPWLQLAVTLLKPVSPQQLLETVQAVLDATNRRAMVAPAYCLVPPSLPRHRPRL